MRIWLTILAVFCVASLVEAAQPTLTNHSFTTANTSEETVSVTMTAGQAVVVVYIKSSTSNRTVSVTDDSGSNNYTSIISTGNCSTARCVEVFADYSVLGGTYTLTVDQSGTLVTYHFWVLQFTCGTSCGADAASFLVDTTNTSHNSSADGTVIDTGANATLVAACTAPGTDMGTITPSGGWELLTGESLNHVMGMFEDDIATVFTDERGAWTSQNTSVTSCVIFAVADVAGGGGGGAGSTTGRQLLLGVG